MADNPVVDRVTLPPLPQSAGQARTFVAAALAKMGLDGLIEAAQLAVSELVTNAVLHANTVIEVAVVAAAPGVRVEVCDDHPAMPAIRDYGGYATTGRGLGLVSTLASRLGIEGKPPRGKRVWFTLEPGTQSDDIDAGWEPWDIDDLLLDADEADTEQDGDADVVLREVPMLLWLAAQQHHDAVLRELVLYRAEHPDEGGRGDLAAAQQAEALLASAVDLTISRAGADPADRRLPDGHPSPLAPVPEALDVGLRADPAVQHHVGALQDVLDEAEHLAAAGRLLVRPALPEVIAVRDWCCEQTIAQLNGVAASPWAGTDNEVFTRADSGRFQTSAPVWDDAVVRESDRWAVAADDNNRIVAVSRPAAALFGWTVDDLVGRRVVSLVPKRYREAHVAGFTRHLTTGEAHVLGVELDLPVLHADGHEVTCTFLIERAPSPPGRTVYIAWLTPVEE